MFFFGFRQEVDTVVKNLKENLSNVQGSAQAAVVNLECAQGAMEKVIISTALTQLYRVMVACFIAVDALEPYVQVAYRAEFKPQVYRARFMVQVYSTELL